MLSTKKYVQRTAVVLGIMAVAGGAYFFTSSGGSFQASLITEDAVTLPVVETVAPGESSQTESSIFDATPTGASLAETGTLLSGGENSMSGVLLTELSTSTFGNAEEIAALETLRPAAAEQASNLLDALGVSVEENTSSDAEQVQQEESSTMTAEDEMQADAEAALENAPHVPQTGPESWLLITAVLCATMGMTLLMTAPQES